MKLGHTIVAAAFAALIAQPALAQQPAAPAPMIKRGATMKISDHTYVILDDNVGFVPNVGIVVGERATLIVDTGMGPDNGAIVLEEARKLSDNTEFYLTATHFHPEHDLGATAFPASAKMIRWRSQQEETDAQGEQTIERFSGFSPAVAQLLSKASYRKPDTVFDQDLTLDLGGVHVRLSGVGPNHTLGDTVMYIEEDKVLLTGDVVMAVFPAASGQSASIEKWLANIDEFIEFAPRVIVPAHGRLIDAGTLARYREYLTAVQTQTRAAKRQGQSVEAAQAAIAPALAQQFGELTPQGGAPATGRINAAIQAAYREAR
ncbi:MAG TPA: MBL fold metallo-hydrolase [Gammaproteobacteria bacterium]|nr:MBL fold metallo-hydrolase [Gammaproteobacteria bacterium]